MLSALIAFLIVVLVVALIAGLVIALIRRAPFIEGEFKSWAEYAVFAIAVLIIIVKALALFNVGVSL